MRERELETQILRKEHEEENLIEQAQGAGVEILQRFDASGFALLHLECRWSRPRPAGSIRRIGRDHSRPRSNLCAFEQALQWFVRRYHLSGRLTPEGSLMPRTRWRTQAHFRRSPVHPLRARARLAREPLHIACGINGDPSQSPLHQGSKRGESNVFQDRDGSRRSACLWFGFDGVSSRLSESAVALSICSRSP